MPDYIGELRKLIGTKPIIICGANVIILDSICIIDDFISNYEKIIASEI